MALDKRGYRRNDGTKTSVFWRWIYPWILMLGWAGLAGMTLAFLGSTLFNWTPRYVDWFLVGIVVSVVLYILYNTPLRVFTRVYPFSLSLYVLFWVFVRPTFELDKLVRRVIRQQD